MANKNIKTILYVLGALALVALIVFVARSSSSPALKPAVETQTAAPAAQEQPTLPGATAAALASPASLNTSTPPAQNKPAATAKTTGTKIAVNTATRSVVSANQAAIATETPADATAVKTKAAATAVNTVTPGGPTLTVAVPTLTATADVTGITQAQLQAKLVSERNFHCATSVAEGLNALTCDSSVRVGSAITLYHIEAYGRNTTGILLIYSSVLQNQPQQDTALGILGYIAGLPFGSQPTLAAQASAWVNSQLPTIKSPNEERQITIGGIQYRLYGTPSSWFMEMGNSTL